MRNEDIPIGFTMELAQHENALSAFSSLTSDQQRQVIDGAKQMKTRKCGIMLKTNSNKKEQEAKI